MLVQLAQNMLVWTRNDLARVDHHYARYGIARMVRDVLQIPGIEKGSGIKAEEVRLSLRMQTQVQPD